MTLEQATFGLSLIVIAMQGISLYTQAKLKVWALERFVSKTDFLDTLNMWSRADRADKERGHA